MDRWMDRWVGESVSGWVGGRVDGWQKSITSPYNICRVGFAHHPRDHNQPPATSQLSLRKEVVLGAPPWNLVGGELLYYQGRRRPLQQAARILRLETSALNWNILRDNEVQPLITPPLPFCRWINWQGEEMTSNTTQLTIKWMMEAEIKSKAKSKTLLCFVL